MNVFVNLFENSIIHNRNELISLDVEASYDSKNNLLIIVRDNGTGITNKETIFKRKELGIKGGIGIGLTLVNRIINSFGGSIQVKDRMPVNPKEGSNFIIQLPTR
jgi:K+-sensing histidine kinase KdpD